MIKIAPSYIPQVLLLGNGLNRTYGGNSWESLLKDIAERADLPEKLYCPYPLQAVLVTNDHVKNAMKNHKSEFYGESTERLNSKLQKLLAAGFDDILTTNYSYELEAASASKSCVTDYFLRKTCSNIMDGETVEGKYLLRTCQRLSYQGVTNRVWHIHGEARKPNSMILGHYYYASLLHRITSYIQGRGNIYQQKQKDSTELILGSWLDSFILGDVYILGFGMDFSEIDLWWLINRKKREKAKHGKVYFYQPGDDSFDEKEELLKLLGVEIIHCGCPFPVGTEQEKNQRFDDFYQKAIDDILYKMIATKAEE